MQFDSKHLKDMLVECSCFCSFLVADLSNGAVKKEASTKEVARIWINDVKMRSFSPTMVSNTNS